MMEGQQPQKIRNGHQTHSEAIAAVKFELDRRGYEVSQCARNSIPRADLKVISPINRKDFLVAVTGLYKRNPWKLKLKPPGADPGLFRVLAFVPEDGPKQFFVMTETQAQHLIRADHTRLNRTDRYPAPGITWRKEEQGEPGLRLHLSAWDILPK